MLVFWCYFLYARRLSITSHTKRAHGVHYIDLFNWSLLGYFNQSITQCFPLIFRHALPLQIHPKDFANSKQLRTYGVRPEAAIPINESRFGFRFRAFKSSLAAVISSSAPFCACRRAISPPAISATNCSLDTEYKLEEFPRRLERPTFEFH
jgi:hypothetical protein